MLPLPPSPACLATVVGQMVKAPLPQLESALAHLWIELCDFTYKMGKMSCPRRGWNELEGALNKESIFLLRRALCSEQRAVTFIPESIERSTFE